MNRKSESIVAFIVWLTLVILLAGIFSACHRSIETHRVSTVKAGQNDFDIGAVPWGRTLTVHACIPQTYYLPSVDSFDWNKGAGIMTNIHPHKTSALLGWRVVNGVVELSPYIHHDDKSTTYLSQQEAVRVSVGEWFTYSIQDTGKEWVFTIEGQSWMFPKKETDGINFRSGWWFGGTSPAPQDLEVWWYVQR